MKQIYYCSWPKDCMTLTSEDRSQKVDRDRQVAAGKDFAVPISTPSYGQLLLGLDALHWERFARRLWTGLVDM